jgi:hypothetical protein
MGAAPAGTSVVVSFALPRGCGFAGAAEHQAADRALDRASRTEYS